MKIIAPIVGIIGVYASTIYYLNYTVDELRKSQKENKELKQEIAQNRADIEFIIPHINKVNHENNRLRAENLKLSRENFYLIGGK